MKQHPHTRMGFKDVPPEPDYMKMWNGKDCKLDGKSAKVVAGTDCARVCTVPFGVSADFSWEAVHRIMSKGGEFTSSILMKGRLL